MVGEIVGLLRRLSGRHAAIDRVVLGFAGLVIVLAAASGDDPASGATARELDGWAVGLLIASAALVVVGSRRFPAGVAMAVVGATLVWYSVGYTSGLVNVVALAAFYRLGSSDAQRRKVTVAVLTVAVVVFNMVVVGDESWRSAAESSGYLVTALLFGELIRSRRLLIEQYAQRARRAEAETERKVTEERMRIARDVHDVLAHTVAAMTVQAGVAADSIERDPRAATDAVETIRRAGREAMNEIRATVAVMRSGDETATMSPAPRLDRLDELVAGAREQGLHVERRVTLSGRSLPELVELTAFRVAQESLTNVVRHAHATNATMTVAEEHCSLIVEIRDDGSGNGRDPVVAGFGLRGMAERVRSIGGTLHHGRDADGWVVRASLPLPDERP